ncbi:MAG: hydroxyacylglutathione hydrolase [Burkholderiaceae bacterium]|jgi:hydroxyacylglutathione hydrolase|nr:hydroxyacylglutathione hydrolase [Burkholderiaceae bacterium]
MELTALPAFEDNYLWLLCDSTQALVVDPGSAPPVTEALHRLGLRLAAILVTHHHGDHTGGVAALRDATGAQVFGPAGESIPKPFTPVHGGDRVQALGIGWRVIGVPGHTAGHVAYFADDINGSPLLFCGDALFSGGCGRIFEGTPAQMLASLDALAALPADTLVCCAHEYTLNNLRFARAVEPDNTALANYQQQCQALRDQGKPTLPTHIGLERSVNPFLRSRQAAVSRSVKAHTGCTNDDVAVFAALRQWKDEFK